MEDLVMYLYRVDLIYLSLREIDVQSLYAGFCYYKSANLTHKFVSWTTKKHLASVEMVSKQI